MSTARDSTARDEVNDDIKRDAGTEPTEVTQDQVIARLRRIEGQVRGIARMLENDRACEDVVTQLMAVRSSIDTVGAAVLDAHLCGCVAGDDPRDQVHALREAMRLWWRFAPAAGGVGADPSMAGARSPLPVPPLDSTD